MEAEVEVVEGGRTVEKRKMKLKKVKEFSDGIIMYENEEGRSVIYSEKDNKYTLVSIDMAYFIFVLESLRFNLEPIFKRSPEKRT